MSGPFGPCGPPARTCNNTCWPCFTPLQLNTRLMPTFLQGLTQAQQCAFIQANTAASNTFRTQVLDFISKLAMAKQYYAQRKFLCPFRVPWRVTNPPLMLNMVVMVQYWDSLNALSASGFAYVITKTVSILRGRQQCLNLIRDGKAGCCSINGFNCCNFTTQ